MEQTTIENLASMASTITGADWKSALGGMVQKLRQVLVFDNLVIYVAEKPESPPEVVYARSLGRGRQAEADASWGESVTNQVLACGKTVQSNPQDTGGQNRIQSPYVLGLPMNMLEARGVLVLIRFGGPQFLDEQIRLAEIFTAYILYVLERHYFQDSLVQLESVKYQTQLQDDFIATISHDFNTPLGFIKGYTTSLLRSDTSWDAGTVQEFLTIIDEETDQLIGLIAQMLDSARLKYGKLPMDFQPVRVGSLLKDLVVRLSTRKKELKLELSVEETQPILGDSNRLAQVFENLIENAVKYAPGSPINIRVGGGVEKVTILVSDKGPGIPEVHIPYLFERFYRVPDQMEKRGTGLGLFICREIVRAHRGTISVRNIEGEGAEFYLEFPILEHGMKVLVNEKGDAK